MEEEKDFEGRNESNREEEGNRAEETERLWSEHLGMESAEESGPESLGQTPPPVPEPTTGTTPPPVNPESPKAPAGPRAPQRGAMPPTYMLWAILSTICCCLPAGVVAIVFAASVSTRWFAGDTEGAWRASHRAEVWIIVSIVAGVIVNTLYVPLSLIGNLS